MPVEGAIAGIGQVMGGAMKAEGAIGAGRIAALGTATSLPRMDVSSVAPKATEVAGFTTPHIEAPPVSTGATVAAGLEAPGGDPHGKIADLAKIGPNVEAGNQSSSAVEPEKVIHEMSPGLADQGNLDSLNANRPEPPDKEPPADADSILGQLDKEGKGLKPLEPGTSQSPAGGVASEAPPAQESVLREVRHTELQQKADAGTATEQDKKDLAEWVPGIEPARMSESRETPKDSVLRVARSDDLQPGIDAGTATPDEVQEHAELQKGLQENKVATPAVAEGEKPAGTETAKAPDAAQTDQEQQREKQELRKKVENHTATKDEIDQFRQGTPQEQQKKLTDKLLNGEDLTDAEAKKLGELNASENGKTPTPEQQREQLDKDIDKLATDLMEKFASGKPVTKEDLERLQALKGEQSLINQGFTEEQSKAVMREAITGNHATGGERQGRAMEKIQREIQELMTIQMQIISVPKTVDALRKQRDTIKGEAQKLHSKASGPNPEQNLQVKGQEYNLYMQMANINAQIIGQKYRVPVLEARRQDLEQYVSRSVKATGGFGAVMEWAGAKANNVATSISVNVQEEVDYRFGNY